MSRPSTGVYRPPFPSANIPDHITRNGAETLARRISNFWAAAGHDVDVWAESFGSHDGRETAWHVRSNLVGGLPKRRK